MKKGNINPLIRTSTPNCLSTICTGLKMKQRQREWPINDWPNLRPILRREPTHGIINDAYRQEPSIKAERLHLELDDNRCRDPYPNIKQRSGSLVKDRIKQARVVKDTTKRPTKSTNLGPWVLQILNHNQKSMSSWI